MEELFAIPAVGAIIRRKIDGEEYILIQTRNKANDNNTNGLFEIPAGKIREYEDIFSALKREVWEETGLRVTKIEGEETALRSDVSGNVTQCAEPFCICQNLSGAYSLVLSVFLCEAEGEPIESSNETCDIHWAKTSDLKEMVEKSPEKFFLMSLNPL